MKQVIKLKGISKNFQNKKVLSNVDLQINEGEILTLLGPSGGGKSTLTKILTSQLKPDSGEGEILGQDIKQLNSDIYHHLGIITDNSGLYLNFNAYDNLILFANIFKVDKNRVVELLEIVGLKDEGKKKVKKFSKGMKQRLALARAFLHEPKILFLDEPTNGLDIASVDTIHRLISGYKAKGNTVFLITHSVEEALELSDNVVVLDNGKLIKVEKTKEAITTALRNAGGLK